MVDFQAGILSMPVEDAAWSPDPFFPGPPGELLEAGQFDTSVDVLLGSNSGEGLLLTQLLYSLPTLLSLVMASWDAWGLACFWPIVLLLCSFFNAGHFLWVTGLSIYGWLQEES